MPQWFYFKDYSLETDYVKRLSPGVEISLYCEVIDDQNKKYHFGTCYSKIGKNKNTLKKRLNGLDVILWNEFHLSDENNLKLLEKLIKEGKRNIISGFESELENEINNIKKSLNRIEKHNNNLKSNKFCIHGRTKYYCIPCKGDGICSHKYNKVYCYFCSGKKEQEDERLRNEVKEVFRKINEEAYRKHKEKKKALKEESDSDNDIYYDARDYFSDKELMKEINIKYPLS